MAVRKILQYPDKRLHTVAKPVKVFDANLEALVKDMADTMYDAPGVGLAATQIDVHLQVIVIDVSEEKNDLMVLINPEILEQSTDLEGFEEGCLSVPGFYGEVDRPAWVKVKALDIHGNVFEITAEGLLAVCIQHEMDHLRGKVFVQHLSTLKQTKAKSHMKKYSKSAESHA